MFGTPEESNWLRNAVQLVREARCLAGRQAAIRVWGQLGLPDLHAPQRQLSASPRLDAIADESVQQWLSERTSSEDATARIKTADLWYDYSQWAAGQNIPAMPLSSFGKELTKIGVEKIMSNGSWCCGIALVDTPSDDG